MRKVRVIIHVVGAAAEPDRQDEQRGEARCSYYRYSKLAARWLASKTSMGGFKSLLLIRSSEPDCLGRRKLPGRGVDELGRRGEPVPNDTQGGD